MNTMQVHIKCIRENGSALEDNTYPPWNDETVRQWIARVLSAENMADDRNAGVVRIVLDIAL